MIKVVPGGVGTFGWTAGGPVQIRRPRDNRSLSGKNHSALT
jgi:hypothetical protein